jgi:transcription termination factor NusB
MTNELEAYGKGAKGVKFLSTGPKSYALKIFNAAGEENTILKIKGFTLDYAAGLLLNFEQMQKMIRKHLQDKDEENSTTLKFKTIIRTAEHELCTTETSKMFRIVYNKRVMKSDGTSVPFGF